MIRKRPKGDPSRTKATYDHKRPRFDPPSLAQLEAAAELTAAECARDRAIDSQIKKVGLAEVLWPGRTQPRGQSIKRRF
jgi:folylpolyglutamate synthase/dihydropteroate synthase